MSKSCGPLPNLWQRPSFVLFRHRRRVRLFRVGSIGSVRIPGGCRGLQSRWGVGHPVPGGFDSHPLPLQSPLLKCTTDERARAVPPWRQASRTAERPLALRRGKVRCAAYPPARVRRESILKCGANQPGESGDSSGGNGVRQLCRSQPICGPQYSPTGRDRSHAATLGERGRPIASRGRNANRENAAVICTGQRA